MQELLRGKKWRRSGRQGRGRCCECGIAWLARHSVAAVTYWLTKRREQEAAWRDLKLKHYQEYLTALSGVVGARATPEIRARYADAANKLSLVAPTTTMTASASAGFSSDSSRSMHTILTSWGLWLDPTKQTKACVLRSEVADS
jgi:hypothetical protein